MLGPGPPLGGHGHGPRPPINKGQKPPSLLDMDEPPPRALLDMRLNRGGPRRPSIEPGPGMMDNPPSNRSPLFDGPPRRFDGPRGRGGFDGPRGRDDFDRPRGPPGFDVPRDFDGPRGPGGFYGPRGPGGFDGPRGPGGFDGPRGRGGFDRHRGRGGFDGPRGRDDFDRPRGPFGFDGPRDFDDFDGPRGRGGFDGPRGMFDMPHDRFREPFRERPPFDLMEVSDEEVDRDPNPFRSLERRERKSRNFRNDDVPFDRRNRRGPMGRRNSADEEMS